MRRWGGFLIILWMSIGGECASQTVATWVDSSNLYPYYSVYTGTSWTMPEQISSTQQSRSAGNVYTAYDSTNQITMATWADNHTGYYSIYQNGSWSSAATITGIAPYSDVFVTFDSYTGQFMASWVDSSSFPNVTFYTNGSWGSSTIICEVYTVKNNVYVAFDTSGHAIATWVNPSSPNNQAVYTTYFEGSWLNSVGEIAVPSNSIGHDTFVSYNPMLGFVATWAQSNEQALYGSYTFVLALGQVNWTSTNFASVTGSHVVQGDMGSSYNPLLKETIVGYNVSGTSSLYYTTLNSSGSWSSDLSTSAPALDNASVYTTYDANTETTLAVFPYASSSPGNPYYATYSGSSWTSNPITTSFSASDWVYAGPISASFGPTNLSGSQSVNNFGTLREYYDTLTWSASSSSSVVSYVIYANGVEVATVPSSDLSCQIHNQRKNGSTIYQVFGLDSSGNLIPGATVTVN